jgi:hypothetical protein
MPRMLLAQALVEHSLLDSIAAGIAAARFRLETYIGQGNSKYLLIAAAAICLLLLLRRRR